MIAARDSSVVALACLYFTQLYTSEGIGQHASVFEDDTSRVTQPRRKLLEASDRQENGAIDTKAVSSADCYCCFCVYDPRVACAACLYISCKVNECAVNASSICKVVVESTFTLKIGVPSLVFSRAVASLSASASWRGA